MITDQTDIGNFQLIHDITLPQELVCNTEVAVISAMDDKIYIIPFIKVIDKVQGLIIPTLGVTHSDKTNSCLILAIGLYLFYITIIYICLTTDADIIRMVIYHIATAHKQASKRNEQEFR